MAAHRAFHKRRRAELFLTEANEGNKEMTLIQGGWMQARRAIPRTL